MLQKAPRLCRHHLSLSLSLSLSLLSLSPCMPIAVCLQQIIDLSDMLKKVRGLVFTTMCYFGASYMDWYLENVGLGSWQIKGTDYMRMSVPLSSMRFVLAWRICRQNTPAAHVHLPKHSTETQNVRVHSYATFMLSRPVAT